MQIEKALINDDKKNDRLRGSKVENFASQLFIILQ